MQSIEMLFLISLFTKPIIAQHENSALEDFPQCDCMEYWECVEEGGAPYSYCDYSSKVCCFVDSKSQKNRLHPRKDKLTNCGLKGADSGKDGETESGEWPWHAAVLEHSGDLYVCGGTLLDEHWVLTAAHCVDENIQPKELKIRLGEHDVSSADEPHPHEEFDVSKIILHPLFDNDTLENDMALLQITPGARRKPHINIVCMPTSEEQETRLLAKRSCHITGWGRQTEKSNNSLILKEVNVPIWRRTRCESALKFQFGTDYQLPSTAICAGAVGRDACDGDGGGPLVCEEKSRWYQVGIISYGIGCGRNNVPGVYTRTYSYMSWIHDTVLKYKT